MVTILFSFSSFAFICQLWFQLTSCYIILLLLFHINFYQHMALSWAIKTYISRFPVRFPKFYLREFLEVLGFQSNLHHATQRAQLVAAVHFLLRRPHTSSSHRVRKGAHPHHQPHPALRLSHHRQPRLEHCPVLCQRRGIASPEIDPRAGHLRLAPSKPR